MLNQSDFYISCDQSADFRFDISSKITRYLLKNIIPQYSREIIKNNLRPFSLYSMHAESGALIRLSTLNEEAIHITDVLSRKNQISLDSSGTILNIEKISSKKPVSESRLADEMTGCTFSLNIVTPAMYKLSGNILNDPAFVMYFYSAVCRLNCFSDIKIDFRDFLNAFKKVIINSYSLSSTTYSLCRSMIPAMTGEMNITVHPDNKKNEHIIKTVLAYASYSGIGGNTSLGMGGFTIEKQTNKICN